MAAALARADGIDAESAGVHAAAGLRAAKHAIVVMRERGLDLKAHRSRHLSQLRVREFDALVAMSRDVGSTLATTLGVLPTLVRDVDDPYFGDLARYRLTADAIHKCLTEALRAATVIPARAAY